MQKFLLSLNLIMFFTFFATLPVFCEEGIFIGESYQDSVNKVKTLENKPQEEPKKEKKAGFFSKFKKDKQFNSTTNKDETIKKGYYGKLPDIGADFKYKQQQAPSTQSIDAKIPNKEDLADDKLKSAPFNDTLFLDNIIKEEKKSNYVNDVQRTKFALERLKDCIEQKGDIQRFNGCVNVVDLYVKNLEKKYSSLSDCYRESYKQILNTNYEAKILGNLMYDANYYAQYIPTQQGQYSKENIEQKQEELLNKINKTLFSIVNES